MATRKKKKAPSEPHSLQPSTLSGEVFRTDVGGSPRGKRSADAGQSGSLQDISREEDASAESVAELLEEGQTREAEVLSGVEKAASEEEEVPTREPGHDSSSHPESTTL